MGFESLAARSTPQVSGLGLFADFDQLVAAHGAVLLRPDRADEPPAVDQLGEVEGATRVDLPGRPSPLLFEVRRRGPGPLLVVWEQRDPFHG